MRAFCERRKVRDRASENPNEALALAKIRCLYDSLQACA